MQKKYKKLLFDLDNTLVDDDENRKYAIKQILLERNDKVNSDILNRFVELDNQFWKDRAERKIKDPYKFESDEDRTRWVRAQRFINYFKKHIVKHKLNVVYFHNLNFDLSVLLYQFHKEFLGHVSLETEIDGVEIEAVLGSITFAKFTFEYELDLKEDLNRMGISDVFEQGKASLKNMTDDDTQFIESAKHKANIEFTQDGLKAAAATEVGGLGAGGWYDYYFEVPTEDIDITFDKPYMFLIRDKKTGETWFVGTVYEPLDAKSETNYISDYQY